MLCLPAERVLGHDELRVGRGSAQSGEVADIPLLLSSDGDVQGLVLVFEWDSAKATGVDLIPADAKGEALAGADLIQKRVADGFMVLGVVMNTNPEDGEEKIPAGDNTEVGTARIRCRGPAQGESDVEVKLEVDNARGRPMVDGGPDLSSIISIGGRSIGKAEGLELVDGTLVCKGEEEPGDREVMFACGGRLSDGEPSQVSGSADSRVPVTFYYKAPAGGEGPRDKIQGLSMAVTWSCDLAAIEESLDLEGGALEEVDAEFVHLDVDNNSPRVDEDRCEFTLGVLVDATAPFDGRTLPTARSLRKLFTIDYEIKSYADCGKCYWLKFMDGLNGNGKVEVKNLVSVNFESRSVQVTHCSICVEGDRSKFIRGDCNFSDNGRSAVDIADAAAMVGHIFLKGEWRFNAPCEDACDSNDDGRLDAADVVHLLNYLFIARSPKPPAPGPTSSGTDPTGDDLVECKGGKTEC